MPDYPDITLDELPGLLAHISPDVDRDTWVQVTMGVKSEFGELAFTDWDAWSQGGSNYKPADALAVWKSCKGSGVSIGTVIRLAKDGGWRPKKTELTAEEKRQRKAEQQARRERRQAELEADEKRLTAMQEQVRAATLELLSRFTKARGKSEYLERKQVGAYGVRFITQSVVLVIDDQRERCDLWHGGQIKAFFDDLPTPRPEHISFLKLDPGTIVIPLKDAETGEVWCFQSINASGKKLFPKYSRKSGCLHVIGTLEGAEVIALAEGYATAASVFEVTQWPTVMTVDVYNMVKVARQIRVDHPEAKIIVAGDDDPTSKGNPGRTKAEALAAELGIAAVFPRWPETRAVA